MARKHYWQFLVTDEGVPVENAQISIYRAGTEEAVWIYTDELSTQGSTTAPQTNSSLKGYFEFWIADESDSNRGYDLTTKFKVAWSAAGVSDGYIDYIDIFSTFIQEVDVNDNSILRNKTVSNELAQAWQDHTVSTFPDVNAHGMSVVNITQFDDSINKLVSNYMGNTWDTHARLQYDNTFSTAASPNLPSYAHGIRMVDETDMTLNASKNKLVSNAQAKTWVEHVDNILADPHPQYMSIDGSDDFTQPIGYSDGIIIDSTTADHFITKAYVDKHRHIELVSNGSYTAFGNGFWYYDVVHNMDELYPSVTVWSDATKFAVTPQNIQSIDATTTRVWMFIKESETLQTLWVRILK